MLIVKLGGSLYNTPELTVWLQKLADYSKHTPVVIVPGGGPFADQVRLAQTHHHFSDSTAHHMAIIAMKQFGLLLADLEPRSQLLATNMPTTAPLSIWLPNDSLLKEEQLEHNWDITADSIALWLATKFDAKCLLLIKYRKIGGSSIQELSSSKIIDSGFQSLFTGSNIDVKILHHNAFNELDSLSHQESLSLP